MNKLFIGLSGDAGAGKDTGADFLMEELSSVKTQKLAFADELREEVAEFLCEKIPGKTLSDIEEVKELLLNRDTKENFRNLLRWWGTELRRNMYDKDYWIQKLISNIFPKTKIVFIPDVRMDNEINFIRRQNGILLKITNNNIKSNKTHQTEIEWDNDKNFDYIIDNSGTKEEFRKKLQFLVEVINNELRIK